jgi:CRP-like cAMP-binding protein
MVGEWKDAAPGEQLLTTGEPTDAICIAISGDLEVRKGPTAIGRLQPGETIGLALALTEEPSSVDAAFLTAGRYVKWPIANLRGFLDKKPDIRAALQRHVNTALAKRVRDAVLR